MLTSASAPQPHAAMPLAVEGPSSEPGTAASASDFFTLMGAAKAAAKKAKGKAGGLANPATAPKPGAGGKAETALALVVAGETGKAGAGTRITSLKGPAEAKNEGEAAKAQQMSALPGAILAALVTATKEAAVNTGDAAAAANAVTPDEAAKPRAKPARITTRRETAEPHAKSDARPSDAATDTARAAKAEAQGTAPQAAKTAEIPAAVLNFTPAPEADPQARALTGEPVITDARIPLATREAAQAGFAAPVLAMRVITRDGVTKSIEIRLDPAELGQVDVKLETGHDGKLKAVLSAENAQAFELLKKDGGALEAALREAGIDLEDGAITFALTDPGPDHSHQREAAYHGAEARRTATAVEHAAAAAIENASWRHGVIDISV